MTPTIADLREKLAAIGTLPVSRQWLYSAIRHCQRNMDLGDYCDDIEAGEAHEPDRYAGAPMADIINALPALLERIEKLEAGLENIIRCDDEGDGLYDCVDNHGGRYQSADLSGWLAFSRTLLECNQGHERYGRTISRKCNITKDSTTKETDDAQS